MIILYKTANCYTQEGLDGSINDLIDEEWELYGSPYMSKDDEGNQIFNQAMVLRSNDANDSE